VPLVSMRIRPFLWAEGVFHHPSNVPALVDAGLHSPQSGDAPGDVSWGGVCAMDILAGGDILFLHQAMRSRTCLPISESGLLASGCSAPTSPCF
jgi:hypothetical protein